MNPSGDLAPGAPALAAGACREERLAQSLASLLPALAALILGVWLHLCSDIGNGRLIVLASAFTAVLAAAAYLHHRRPRGSALALIAGSAATSLTAIYLLPEPATASLPLFPPLLAGLLLGPAAGLGVGAVLAAGFLFLPFEGYSASWMAYTAAGGGVLTCVGLRPWQELLELSYRRGSEARVLVEQLRDNQGKLNRTIRALDTAYRLLESSNHALALARQEAEHLRQLKSRFAASLSHELRTPLNIILGFSELLYRNPGFYGMGQWSDGLRRDLAQIQRNAGYLSSLLDDILDLARLDANAMPVRREYSDLARVLEGALRGVESLAEEKDILIERDWEPQLPSVYIDETRIRQVLYNLLSNAIRVTAHGRVLVSARRQPQQVVVSVSDEGPGIPAEALEWIFDEYRQLDGSAVQAERGKGLGLAIARQFVHLHGGRIWAENRPEGGATISFTIPLQDLPSGRLGRAQALPLPRSRLKPRLVVLAHAESALTYLRRRLEGYDLVAVEGAAQLADQWEALRPAAVIETVAPGGLQEPLTLSLPEPVPHIRFTLPGPHKVLDGAGFDAVLTKPMTSERLLEALDGGANGRRTLIVDDDRGFVQLVRRMLEASGDADEVLTAYSGAEAIRLARRHCPDIVLLDLVMPGMSGLEVLHALREMPELAHTRILAVTAAVSGDEAQAPASFSVWGRSEFQEDYLLGLLGAALSSHLPEPDAAPGSPPAPAADGPARPAW
ncbi:MAG: hybrid sensor histidine kinase/response regulator [Anaerolineae bacterium]|nr:hybrid sensor histidine kinase/response regulator [Anaerolineae bacterium]